MSRKNKLPEGRRFAFTILDDTDDSTLENIRPVYDWLREHGFRTTKTVWAHDYPPGSQHFYAADTLQREDYLAYVHELVDDGFELASHGATMESSKRRETQRAIRFLESEFGACPRLYVNHAQNREDIYWGAKRFRTRPLRWALTRLREYPEYAGELEESSYFWGDMCREHFQYVRNFTFSGLNLLRANPDMPYSLEGTPYVRYWFSTSDAPDAREFQRRVTREALEQLEDEGGICIVSTHLGKGFSENGRLIPEIASTLRYLASRPGWFVPVSKILDHLGETSGERRLTSSSLLRLELRYLLDQLLIRLGTR